MSAEVDGRLEDNRISFSSVCSTAICLLRLPAIQHLAKVIYSSNLYALSANLTSVTSPPNSYTGGSCLIFSVPFSYFLFIFYLPQCTLPDFPSDSSLASLQFLSSCHRATTCCRTNIIKFSHKNLQISQKIALNLMHP